ncbi:MAG: type 4a pilus biogenesis protein PilO [Acidobacteriia bacterium]|nr:type 4a pilus biogenesis protein PilO [Terriglobia bacterium]
MSRGRRKTLIRVLEIAAAGVVALDVVLYLALVRPLRSLREGEEASYAATRDRLRDGKARVARLEKFKATLPDAEEQLTAFFKDHVPPRRRGFSRAARLVRELAEQAGVQVTGITYKLGHGKDEPLERLALDVEVEGPFASLLKFAHALETADDFIALRDISFQPVEGGTLTLHVGADLYLTP